MHNMHYMPCTPYPFTLLRVKSHGRPLALKYRTSDFQVAISWHLQRDKLGQMRYALSHEHAHIFTSLHRTTNACAGIHMHRGTCKRTIPYCIREYMPVESCKHVLLHIHAPKYIKQCKELLHAQGIKEKSMQELDDTILILVDRIQDFGTGHRRIFTTHTHIHTHTHMHWLHNNINDSTRYETLHVFVQNDDTTKEQMQQEDQHIALLSLTYFVDESGIRCNPTSEDVQTAAMALPSAVHLAIHPVTFKFLYYTATGADLTSAVLFQRLSASQCHFQKTSKRHHKLNHKTISKRSKESQFDLGSTHR